MANGRSLVPAAATQSGSSLIVALLTALALALIVPAIGCSREDAGGATGANGAITILWAQWPPSDHLQELGKTYEKETGTAVKVVQKSWSGAFGEATQQEFKTNGQTYDIIVGDSQWIGQGVKGGHYVELTDFIKENAELFEDVAPAAMKFYCEDPKGSGRYWAVPCEGDAMAWCYRKDLFEDPKHKDGFRKFLVSRGQTQQYELEPPKSWDQLLWIARYFKEGSGVPDLAGVTMPTSRQYDTLLMMFQNVFWAFGGEYGTTQEVKIDSPETQEAIAFFKQLLETSSTGGRNQDYGAVASSYIAGNAAMCANFLGFFPQIDDPEQNKNYADQTGYFNMPAGPKGRFASLGGQGLSINAHISPERQARAKEFLKWFSKPETQREWVKGKGCFTTNTAILKSEEFKNAAPYNPLFDEAFSMVNDFWSIAEFDPMLTVAQQQLSAIFQDNKDPVAAVKEIQTRWEQVLKDAGYMKQVAGAR